MADEAARARRDRRRDWSIQRFGPDEGAAMADADAKFWDEIPVEQRASVTWQLSLEGYCLAHGDDLQRGLPRADYRLVRH